MEIHALPSLSLSPRLGIIRGMRDATVVEGQKRMVS